MKHVQSRKTRLERSAGFTAVEFMIGLGVAAILLAGSIPTFSAVLHKNRVESTASQLYANLNLARGEALKRRRVVELCPSADGASCRDDGDWTGGWVIFQDENGNGSPDTGELIRRADLLPDGIEIQVSAGFNEFIRFQPTGAATGSGGNSGEFRLCHSNTQSKSKVVSVLATGRVESESRAQTDCGVTSS